MSGKKITTRIGKSSTTKYSTLQNLYFPALVLFSYLRARYWLVLGAFSLKQAVNSYPAPDDL
jgi:hypothetical protein